MDTRRRPEAPAARSWRGLLAGPVAPETWRSWSFGAVSIITATAAVTLVTAFVATSAGLAIVFIGLPLLALSLALIGGLAHLERARIGATLLAAIAPPSHRAAPPGSSRLERMRVMLTDRRRWSEAFYFVAAFGLMVANILTLALFAAGLAALAYPLYRNVGDLRLPAAAVIGITAGGAVAILLAPLLAQLVARAQVSLAHSLLGPDPEREAELAARQRIETLTETRKDVLDAADAERRRIERDLHDGAQQRLVALGVELGMARRRVMDPESAAVINHAHSEVKESLAELRNLVRGIHPAILTDRGFDAAISALAARCPVAVDITVGEPERIDAMPESVKTAAYFVAAEALTNVAKHARATTVTLEAEPLDLPGEALWLTISDDGIGGAVADAGGGLAGLRQRLAALDGDLFIESEPGAGTRLEATIPAEVKR